MRKVMCDMAHAMLVALAHALAVARIGVSSGPCHTGVPPDDVRCLMTPEPSPGPHTLSSNRRACVTRLWRRRPESPFGVLHKRHGATVPSKSPSNTTCDHNAAVYTVWRVWRVMCASLRRRSYITDDSSCWASGRIVFVRARGANAGRYAKPAGRPPLCHNCKHQGCDWRLRPHAARHLPCVAL